LDAGACEFLLKDQLADLGSLIEASDHRERI